MNLKPLQKFWNQRGKRLPRWILIPSYAARDLIMDDGFEWSAAIAFYGILSVFPLALGVISVATWFIDPRWAIREASEILGAFMPRADTIRDILKKAVAERSQIGLLSLIFLLWSGTRVFSVLIRALNVACDVDQAYGYFRRLRVEFEMLLSVGLLFLAALLSYLMVPILGQVLASVPGGKASALAAIGFAVPALLLLGGFFSLYKFVSRNRCNWQSSLWGSGAATALTLCARPLFHAYVTKLASYNHIYGLLAIGIVILIWAQILALITLYGGELASHIQMMVYEGGDAKKVARRHLVRSSANARVKGS
jgi:membrane protein